MSFSPKCIFQTNTWTRYIKKQEFVSVIFHTSLADHILPKILKTVLKQT